MCWLPFFFFSFERALMGWVSTDKFNRILTSEKNFLRENKITFFFKSFWYLFCSVFFFNAQNSIPFPLEPGRGNGGRCGGGTGGSNLTSIKFNFIWRMEVARSPVERSSSATSTGDPRFWFGGNFFFFFLIKRLFKNVRSLQVSQSFPFAKVACVCQLFADALIFSLRKECSWGGSSNTRVQK